MASFKIELVSNASSKLFANSTLSSITKFLPEQVNLDGQREALISEIYYPSMYQNVAEGLFKFYDEKLFKTTEAYYVKPGLYSSKTEFLEAMNTVIPERNNHRESCITIKVSRV